MGLIINDNDKCACGAYWTDNWTCTNGHPRKYNFEVYACSCGGQYTVNDWSWPSRKHCNAGCGRSVDLSDDECWHTKEELRENWHGHEEVTMSSNQTEERCTKCNYEHGILDVDANRQAGTFYCLRCGFHAEDKQGVESEQENGSATSYKWKGTGVSSLGGITEIVPFFEWAQKNRPELEHATYTELDEGSWFLVDALTSRRVHFPAGEFKHVVEKVLWRVV